MYIIALDGFILKFERLAVIMKTNSPERTWTMGETTTAIPNPIIEKLLSPKSRPWYKKKRNFIRFGIVLAWLTGVIVVMAKYSADVRDIFWIGISGYCGVLLLFTLILAYILQRMLRSKGRIHKMEYFFLLILFVMSLYPVFQLGNFAADIVQGPIILENKIMEQWNPSRGGDKVRTWDGKQYEIVDSEIKLKAGSHYRLQVLEHSKLILDAAEL